MLKASQCIEVPASIEKPWPCDLSPRLSSICSIWESLWFARRSSMFFPQSSQCLYPCVSILGGCPPVISLWRCFWDKNMLTASSTLLVVDSCINIGIKLTVITRNKQILPNAIVLFCFWWDCGLPGLVSNTTLPISASQVSMMIGVSHWRLASQRLYKMNWVYFLGWGGGKWKRRFAALQKCSSAHSSATVMVVLGLTWAILDRQAMCFRT
jgi:hypothetical protein